MKKNVLITALLAMPVVLTGCMRSVAKTNMQPESAMVAVRFVAPSETETWTGTDPVTGEETTQLVVDHAYDGHAGVGQDTTGNTMVMGRHVALWGGPFDASDVTHQLAALTPGSYTFAFVDPGQSDMIQGWMDVNNIGHDVVQMLQGWKNDIPEQKRMLAYHFETGGQMNESPIGAFEDFTEQLEAFNKLEAQIDRAIVKESKATTDRNHRVATFLQSAELLVMPGDDTVFHPTTKAMFTNDDLTGVRGGDANSKIVVVADWKDVQRKQDVVNDLFSGFSRYRSVLEQAAQRMERRKGLMLLTDHLRSNDRRFVDTEMRLQYTMGEIERVNGHMSDLRDRRMALAFISGLLSPDGQFAAMNREEQQLQHEMTVLEAEMNQLNILFNEAEPNSNQRVAIERNRQRVATSMEVIDQQSANITEAKTALETMANNTDVMHRQGDYQLLTATYVGQQLPFRVRTAVEREALMTVRIETTDRVFVPNQSTVASSSQPKSWFFGRTAKDDDSNQFYGHSGQGTTSSPNRWERGNTTTKASFNENPPQSDGQGSSMRSSRTNRNSTTGSGVQSNQPHVVAQRSVTRSNDSTSSGQWNDQGRGGNHGSMTRSTDPRSNDSTNSGQENDQYPSGSQRSVTRSNDTSSNNTTDSGQQNSRFPGSSQGSMTRSTDSSSGNSAGVGQPNNQSRSGSQGSTAWPGSSRNQNAAGHNHSQPSGVTNSRSASSYDPMRSGNMADYHHHHNHPNYKGHPNNQGHWMQGKDGKWQKVSYKDGQTTDGHGRVHYGRFVGHTDSPQNKKATKNFCDCPLFVRIFFPPAWFEHEHKKH